MHVLIFNPLHYLDVPRNEKWSRDLFLRQTSTNWSNFHIVKAISPTKINTRSSAQPMQSHRNIQPDQRWDRQLWDEAWKLNGHERSLFFILKLKASTVRFREGKGSARTWPCWNTPNILQHMIDAISTERERKITAEIFTVYFIVNEDAMLKVTSRLPALIGRGPMQPVFATCD